MINYRFKDDEIFLIEVNPRASRTIPFVSKATGVSLANIAVRAMTGVSLRDQGFIKEVIPKHYSVKESVFPFNKFLGVDPYLGPEMRSTGEVMGIDKDFNSAFLKSQISAGISLPTKGTVFLSVKDKDKNELITTKSKQI